MKPAGNSVLRCKPLLGTFVKVLVVGERAEEELLATSARVFKEIQRTEELMSFHDARSELFRINERAHRESVEISPQTAKAIAFALDLCAKTQGRFELTVGRDSRPASTIAASKTTPAAPANWRDVDLEGTTIRFKRPLRINLGSIVKGYAVDRGFTCLDDGIEAIVDAGGALRMSHWRDESVVIRVPNAMGQKPARVQVPMQNCAVSTMANANIHSRRPVFSRVKRQPIGDHRTVSVFAPNSMLAEALTQTALLDPESGSLFASYGAKCLIVDPETAALNGEPN
ncbi:MAG: FAD:protein FMN transferase [Acidobacteriota bacterium]